MATRANKDQAAAQAHANLLAELTPAATDLILALDELERLKERVAYGADSTSYEDLRAETDNMTVALLRILVSEGVVTNAAAKDAAEWIGE